MLSASSRDRDTKLNRDTKPDTKPWSWRVSPDALIAKIAEGYREWVPAPALGIDVDEIRTALAVAAQRRAPWLLHPMVCAIALKHNPGNPIARDFQLVVWLAAHNALSGRWIEAPEPLWIWSPGGSLRIEAGRHDLPQLGQAVMQSPSPGPVTLDVWCHTLGAPVHGSWAALPQPLLDQQQNDLERDLISFFRAWSLFGQLLPDCADWVGNATHVIIPLQSCDAEQFRSCSAPDLPGLVELDLFGGDMQILEALVHETSHHYLYRAEAASPLVDAGHNELYRSPLRPEPRPLRGILMAWHALAFIAVLYREAAERGLRAQAASHELAHVLTLLDQAGDVLSAAQGGFTPAGDEFYQRTRAVAAYAHG